MKRIVAIILVIVMLLSLVACKSEMVKATESAIKAIGTVTLESSDAIAKAEKLLENLTDDEKSKVSNREDLIKARESYQKLLEESAAEVDKEIGDLLNGFMTKWDLAAFRDGLQAILPKCNEKQAATVQESLKTFTESNCYYPGTHFLSFRTFCLLKYNAEIKNSVFLDFTKNNKEYVIALLEGDDDYELDSAYTVFHYGNVIGKYKGYMLHKDSTVSMDEYYGLGSAYTNAIAKKCKYEKTMANWGWSKELNETQTVYTDDLGNKMYVVKGYTAGNYYIRVFIK